MPSTETETELRRRLKGEGHITMTHLQEQERKIRDHIAELHAGDKEEREALRAQLTEVQEHIKSQKAAQEKADDVKDSKTTMVVPPTDIPAQQPNVPTTVEEPEKKKRLRWY